MGGTRRKGHCLVTTAREPRAYELMTILVPELAEDDLTNQIGKISSQISGVTGAIKETLTDSPWGRRRLAYSIRHNSQDYRDGYYVVFHFDLQPSRMTEIERELKLDVNVMRYLLVHDDPKAGEQDTGQGNDAEGNAVESTAAAQPAPTRPSAREPVAENAAPATDQQASDSSAPVDDVPVGENEPTADEEPVVENVASVTEESVAENEASANEEPVAESSAAVDDRSAADASSSAAEEPVVVEAPAPRETDEPGEALEVPGDATDTSGESAPEDEPDTDNEVAKQEG